MTNFEWLLFTTIWCSAYQYVLARDSSSHSQQHRSQRVKRIFNGIPLYHHSDYNTHFMVDIRYTYGCTTEQSDHKMEDCKYSHICGGSLVTSDFVLTACHCMVYEDYYLYTDDLPAIEKIYPQLRKIDISKIPGAYLKPHTYHPVLNAMTLWAGDTTVSDMKMTRHARNFFPHSLCMERQKMQYPDMWKEATYEFDIGLILVCDPFPLGKLIKLAPIMHGKQLEYQIFEVTRKNPVCLFVGWGMYDGTRQPSDILRHEFRYVECHQDCEENQKCTLCSHHIGPRITHPDQGDSGGPVICRNYDIGVISRGHEASSLNLTVDKEVAIFCVKELITPVHLAFLRSTSQDAFHWMNGDIVPMENEPPI